MEEVSSPHSQWIANFRRCLRAAGLVTAFGLCASAASGAGGGGRIGVATVPAGATVYLDGQPSGKSPAALENLAPGHYFVRIEMDGYRPAELVVDLGSGQKYQSPQIDLVPVGAAPSRAAAPIAPAPAPAVPAVRATPTPVPRTLEAGGFPATSDVVVPTPQPAPRATPAPLAIVPTPSASPVPAVPAAAPASPAASDDTPVQAAVNDYLNAIADGNIDAYVQLCAPTVEFYEDGAKSQSAIRKIRQQFKDRWPVYKIDNVRDLSVKAGDKPGVKRAAVTYDWNVSNPKTGKKANGTATDQLDFRETNGKWLLVRARQSVDRNKR